MMANPPKDVEMEDEYDEEADSDFDIASNDSHASSPSSDDDEADTQTNKKVPKRRQKDQPPPDSEDKVAIDLDSGDEVTIKEHKRERRKLRKQGIHVDAGSGDESEGWRARTRTMREKEKDELRKNKLATTKGSSIDVEKLWAQMNDPSASQPTPEDPSLVDTQVESPKQKAASSNKKIEEEMITIKRVYKFAGEVHTEERLVPKASAEARLWIAQQSPKDAVDVEGRQIQRPLRRISRFDPNASDISSFRGSWEASKKGLTGPKLNVVEKSKMDWAVHVDSEGLKEELDEHSRAKEGYLNRMDFLRDVEQRKEDNARSARLKGQ